MIAQSTDSTQSMGRERAPSEVFELPVEKMRAGYYTDTYFNRTQHLVAKLRPDTVALMQVFQKHEATLGGIDEAIAILRECSGEVDPIMDPAYIAGRRKCNYRSDWVRGWKQLTVRALHEGDRISPHEPVLTIEGPYRLFAHLETLYLGVLARRTRIATNVTKVIKAANGKPVMFFPARHDHWVVQTGDGYTAHMAGVAGVSTDAQATWWGGRGMGTVPHALIAAFGGDTMKAAVEFAKEYGAETDVSVLVDFDNDCPMTALNVAQAFKLHKQKLWGVRLDTSGTMVDYGLIRRHGLGQFSPVGVNPELVRTVRETLDVHDFQDVKIIVSGGFTPEKIAMFEAQHVPVDSYGVGSSLIQGEFDFTADIVGVNGRPCAKVGRTRTPNTRLEVVE